MCHDNMNRRLKTDNLEARNVVLDAITAPPNANINFWVFFRVYTA
jgi:hypothetical protein